MKKPLTALLLAATAIGALPATAMAQTSPADRRADRQDVRDERRDLNQDRREYRDDRRDARADGVVTPGERRELRGDRADVRDSRSDVAREQADVRRNDYRDGRRGDYRNDRGGWNDGWRNDRRYDWQAYRNSNRGLYRLPRYAAPRGYSYRSFGPGYRLQPFYYGRSYWIADPYRYRLPAAYGSYRWVRYYDDVLLVDVSSGLVRDVIRSFFR